MNAIVTGKILMENITDIFVIGGGINGTAIAADAAGRGLSVTLCEKGDFASGTSSASTKLIHGGLRYLELYEFNLVKKALREREVLLRRAPNIITPLEFVLPYKPHIRPAWLIRLGLFLYDHLTKRRYLPQSKSINFKKDVRGQALLPSFQKGFSYYDCFTDDARLVILNALSARENGANLLTHTQFISAQQDNKGWLIQLKNNVTQQVYTLRAKTLINTAGPWIADVQTNIQSKMHFAINLVKGSHIIVPKLYEGDFAYLLQNPDDRIVFSIPYQDHFTLIGTTDVASPTNLNHLEISQTEKEYLCQTINQYFRKNLSLTDIVYSYSGVRCLQAEPEEKLSKITREYKLLLEQEHHFPLITVIGGKITTHRTLAEHVMELLIPYFPTMGQPWTKDKSLPGSDFKKGNFNLFYDTFKKTYSWLPEKISFRYAKNYGTRAYLLLNNIDNISGLGEEFAAGLYQCEVEFLIKHEWARTAEDILWRRTKLGLLFNVDDIKKLEKWLEINNFNAV